MKATTLQIIMLNGSTRRPTLRGCPGKSIHVVKVNSPGYLPVKRYGSMEAAQMTEEKAKATAA